MRVLMVGLPGSGKSTQSELLSNELNVPVISSGGIFRELSTREDETAKRLKAIMDSGQLVGDEETATLVKQKIAEPDCQNGFVMEGYPRNQKQIDLLGLKFDKVFYLKIAEGQATERLYNRGRSDDDPEVAKKRFEVQRQQMQEVISYYRQQGVLVELDGCLSIDSLHQQILKAING